MASKAAGKVAKGAAKGASKGASKEGERIVHPREKSVFQLVNGLRYFGLGSKVTRYNCYNLIYNYIKIIIYIIIII